MIDGHIDEVLKPCPKCGEMPERQFSYRVKTFTCWQRYCCTKCGIRGDGYEYTAEAIEAWNRRDDNG